MRSLEYRIWNLEFWVCVKSVYGLWESFVQTWGYLHTVFCSCLGLRKSLEFAHILYPDFAQRFAHVFNRITPVNSEFCPSSTLPTRTTIHLKGELL